MLDRAGRPQPLHPAWPAVTGPSATPSDGIVLHGMQRSGFNPPAHLLVQGGTAIPLSSLERFQVIVVNGRTLLTIPV